MSWQWFYQSKSILNELWQNQNKIIGRGAIECDALESFRNKTVRKACVKWQLKEHIVGLVRAIAYPEPII